MRIEASSSYGDSQIQEAVKSAGESGIYTTHSETHRPIHVPVYERYPINVPHPVAIAVPQYIRVPIPQPYPKYTHVQHRIEIPVYRIIPEIIEKPVPYIVEKAYPSKIFNHFKDRRKLFFCLQLSWSRAPISRRSGEEAGNSSTETLSRSRCVL